MLSPYIDPRQINNGAGISSKLVDDTMLNQFGDLDKRNELGVVGKYSLRTVVNTTKSITDSIANLAGSRSPYYIIGEIPESVSTGRTSTADRLNSGSWIGGMLVRAITQNALTKTEQKGVIIDCLGDVNSTIAVKFTQNPLYYQTDNVIDSRLREPIKLRATVGVSNYLSDNITGAGQALAELDPTGTVNQLANHWLYDGMTRSQYALTQLRVLMETGAPFTVYTPHGYYENMLIQSLSPKTNENTMDMLLCEIEFVEAIMYMPYYNQSTSSGVKEAAKSQVTEDNSGKKAKEKTEIIGGTK